MIFICHNGQCPQRLPIATIQKKRILLNLEQGNGLCHSHTTGRHQKATLPYLLQQYQLEKQIIAGIEAIQSIQIIGVQFQDCTPSTSDSSIHLSIHFPKHPPPLGLSNYYRGKLRRCQIEWSCFYIYFYKQMRLSRPEPKPNRRMMIENDLLYSDSGLIKMTCQALNSLNGKDCSSEETGMQFTLPDKTASAPPQCDRSYCQVETHYCNIDDLLNLDREEEGERMAETLLQESYTEESSTFSLRPSEKGKQQSMPLVKDSPNPPLEPSLGLSKKADTKNIACYVSRFVSRAMLNRYEGYLKARCAKAGVNWSQFKEFIDPNKFKGINSLIPFFSPGLNEAERRKKEIFTHLFQKILRRHYLRLIEDQGHMASRELYIQFKNKQLLHCESALPQS